jgi:hypothetical protein
MTDTTARPSELFALLIGIDYYLGNEAPDGAFYDSLNGCVNDILGAQKFLQERLKLDDAHLFKLTATNLGIAAAEPPEALPTRKNIIAAFDALTDTAQAGDQIYIHYSGHGGRALTIYPDLKGADGLDESIVPMDIGSPDVNYVRDLEIATLLKRMVDKGLVVTLVLDSCHSGGATRGNPNARVRSARGNQIDRAVRRLDNLVGTPQELQALWMNTPKTKTRGVEAVSGWLPEPKGYVMLAACRANELANEDEFGDAVHGALTYWLLDALQNVTRETTYAQLHNRLVGKVHSRFVAQTPQLEGDMTRTLFGSDHLTSRFAINVLAYDAAKKQVRVNVGQSGLVNVGATLAIYPGDARDFSDVQARIALAQVTELGGGDSIATVTEILDATKPLDAGAQAVVLNTGRLDLVRRVAFITRADVPQTIDQAQALRAVQDAIAAEQAARAAAGETSLIESADAKTSPHYQISVNARGEYEISDSGGTPFPNLSPALRVDDSTAPSHVAKRLEHLARYHAIVELENYDDASPLADKLVAQLLLPPPSWQRGQKIDFAASTAAETNAALGVGETFILQITNKSKKVLNFAVLDLAPDWSVKQIFPGEDEATATLEPGKTVYKVYRTTLGEAYQTGTDILKVMATTETGSFRWLELMPLGGGPRATRGAQTPRTALEALLNSINFPATRGVETVRAASQEWVSVQVQLTVTRS